MMSFVKDIQQAAKVLKKGGVILYPTDTIWGIGADATNPEPVSRVISIKGREEGKPMIILVDGTAMLEKYVKAIPPAIGKMIAEAADPLTVIFPGARNLPGLLLGSDGSAGIRLTRDEFCLALIRECAFPLLSTSANFSGDPSPAAFADIPASLAAMTDYVVHWRQDETTPSRPSRIVKVETGGRVTVLRG